MPIILRYIITQSKHTLLTAMKKPLATSLPNRLLFLSPTVQAGWQQESHITQFKLQQKLGNGSFGTVYKAIHKKTNKIYAIKEIKKNILDNQKLKQHARNQVRIMYVLNHPNIVKLYNHFQDQVAIYLVLEYVENGQLYGYVSKQVGKKLGERVAAMFTGQIVSAVGQIHRNKIMHRDLKLENILLADQNTTKIADFGWSHYLSPQQKRTTYCGTLDYLAPQMIEKGHLHDERVDIWSIGVLIYQMCTGYSPFSCTLIGKDISIDNVKKNIKTLSYKLPQQLSPQCKNLITSILKIKPEQRLSLSQIQSHPWLIKNISNSKINKKQDNWVDLLSKQMKEMFPEDSMVNVGGDGSGRGQGKGEYFTKDEIYLYTRPDSIINLKPKKKKDQLISSTQYQATDVIGKSSPVVNSKAQLAQQKPTATFTPSPYTYNFNTPPSVFSAYTPPNFSSSATSQPLSSGYPQKKFSQLQLKISELESQNKTQKQEIKRLKQQLSHYKDKPSQQHSPSLNSSPSPSPSTSTPSVSVSGTTPQKNDHTQCKLKIKQLMEQILKQHKNMELLSNKLGESQRKVFMYQSMQQRERK